MVAAAQSSRKISWYRSPVDKDTLALLYRRSDWMGLAQSLGHLGLLALTGAAAWVASANLPVWALLILLYLHGTLWAFLLNGFHELCHKTVFKSKFLNTLFLDIFSFLSWNNPVWFWASHQEHHKYTLHPPDDLEVVLPVKLPISLFLQYAVVNPWDLLGRLKTYLRHAFGRLEGQWENHIFPASNPALRRSLFTWARIQLIGHALILVVSLAFGLWIIPILITLPAFYGGALQFLCNNTQHSGLMDRVPDYRLCCRTVYLNPFLRFLYWQMNYHTEHHMFAAVPFYHLPRLHEAIKDDLPHCPSGLVETWRGVIEILEKQKVDPGYQFVAELPEKTR
jgi:fatty acid desaturase